MSNENIVPDQPPQIDEPLPRITRTGEKRVRLADLKKATGSGKARVDIADMLLGTINLEGDDGTEVSLKPVNLRALAQIEKVAARGLSNTDTMIQFVYILANQEVDEGQQPRITEAQVGKLLNVENLELVTRLVQELVNPLLDGSLLASPATGSNAPTGDGSSTSSPTSSAS